MQKKNYLVNDATTIMSMEDQSSS